MIRIDSTGMVVQAVDSNNKETGYISYSVASDRYYTRGTVKQAVKKLYDFAWQGLEMSSVTYLFCAALNPDGTVRNQLIYAHALIKLRYIKEKYGL